MSYPGHGKVRLVVRKECPVVDLAAVELDPAEKVFAPDLVAEMIAPAPAAKVFPPALAVKVFPPGPVAKMFAPDFVVEIALAAAAVSSSSVLVCEVDFVELND